MSAFLLIIIAAGAVESGWRLADRIRRDIPVTTFLPDHRETQFLLSPFLVFGPRIDHQIRDRELPEQAYFDGRGFRTNEPVRGKPAGEFRILAVGGSTTGHLQDGPVVRTHVFRLERFRSGKMHDARVLGVHANPSARSVDMAELLPAEPSLFLDVMHYTTEGVLRFGELLARELQDRIPAAPEPYELSPPAVRRCAW